MYISNFIITLNQYFILKIYEIVNLYKQFVQHDAIIRISEKLSFRRKLFVARRTALSLLPAGRAHLLSEPDESSYSIYFVLANSIALNICILYFLLSTFYWRFSFLSCNNRRCYKEVKLYFFLLQLLSVDYKNRPLPIFGEWLNFEDLYGSNP